MPWPLYWLLLLQTLYYGITGLWPIVHMDSFLKMTGPKTDLWLVKTVGALIVVIAGAMGVSVYRNALPPETLVLAMGSAAALTAVDVVYVLKRRIMPIYLLDAAAEVVLIGLWIVGLTMWGT